MNDLVEVGMRDKENPRSLINLLPTNVARALEVIPEDMLLQNEEELRKLVNPDVLEERLRIAFWSEYDAAQRQQRKMRIASVYGGLCSSTYFAKRVITSSFKLA